MTTTYVVPDTTGRGTHCRVTFTEQEQAAFGDMLEQLFADGVARYGSVDAFTDALDWYNTLHRANA